MMANIGKCTLLLICLYCAVPNQHRVVAVFDMSDENMYHLVHHMAKAFIPRQIKDVKVEANDLSLLKNFINFSTDYFNLNDSQLDSDILCLPCTILIGPIVNGMRNYPEYRENYLTFVKLGCRIFAIIYKFGFGDFCESLIDTYTPSVQYIIQNGSQISDNLICSTILQMPGCHADSSFFRPISVPPKNETLLLANYNREKIARKKPEMKLKPLKILHLTDLHISPDYDANASSNCGYPVCCLKDQKSATIPIRKSGKWGDYNNCDLPEHTYIETLKHIKNAHTDLDYVYFTGDIIDHKIWEGNINKTAQVINYTLSALHEHLKLPIFPIIGNHDAVPINMFPPNYIDNQQFSHAWLYETFANHLDVMLSGLKTNKNMDRAGTDMKQYGYYTFSINEKFRIIGLHSALAYHNNLWLLYDNDLFDEQLQWLVHELTDAEIKGQYVHILSHIPPGNRETTEIWDAKYNQIINRFSHIIVGQFFGHTHTDELKIFYDENGKPINVGQNGASLTPHVHTNPNYKIYTINPYDYKVIDADTYIFNLSSANTDTNSTPQWYKLYSLKQAYGLKSLDPIQVDNLVKEMAYNATLFDIYFRYYVKYGGELDDGCDQSCKNSILCKITTTVSNQEICP